jgi:hypothetical protein
VGASTHAMIGFCCRQGLPTTTIVDKSYLRRANVGHHKLLVIYDGWNWAVVNKFKLRWSSLGHCRLFVIYTASMDYEPS